MAKAIGLIAAAGELPVLLARALMARGMPPVVVKLNGIADADFPASITTHSFAVGAIGEILGLLKKHNCGEVIFSGRLPRSIFADLTPDAVARTVAEKARVASDNDALEIVAAVFAQHGVRLADLTSLLPEIFADLGCMAGSQPSQAEMAALTEGVAVLHKLGASDVGQAVVVQEKRVLAIEAAEGTDAMLGRVKPLVDEALTRPVLVKLPKLAQNPKLDPPVIGSQTIAKAAAAGIRVVAVAAGGVIIADREASLAAAKKHNLTLIGVAGG